MYVKTYRDTAIFNDNGHYYYLGSPKYYDTLEAVQRVIDMFLGY